MRLNNIKIIYPVLIGIIVYLAYCSGVDGQFQFDDYPNIVLNERLHIKSLDIESITKASLSSTSGLLKRPISMASLAVNYYFSGLNPFSYKLTNLLIHVVNTIGIYWLCLLLFDSINYSKYYISKNNISFVTALAWGIHPINLTAVLYVVQRMTSLAAFFTICATGLYLKARKELDSNHIKKGTIYLLIVLILGLLSVLSKENGILIFVYLFVIELCLYREKQHSQNYRKIISIFYTLFLILPAIAVAIYTVNSPGWILEGYSATSFTPYERLITQARIVWMYFIWILFPNNGSLGFIHDDVALSIGLFDSTLPIISVIGHLLSISFIIILWKRQKQPFIVLGCCLFYASHLIESTVYPLILVFEHRNYFGSFGLMLAIFSFIFSSPIKYKRVALIGVTAYIACLIFITAQRAMVWGDGLRNAMVDVQHHPDSTAAHYELGNQYSRLGSAKFQKQAAIHFKKASEIDTKRADSLFALLMLSAKNKEPVKQELVDEISYRLRTSPVYAGHITWLGSLLRCYTDTACEVSAQHMATMIQASLDNSQLDRTALSKSYFLMIASGFLANSGGDYEQALNLSIQAAHTSPGEVKFTINVIDLALARKDYSTADQWISKFDESFSNLYPQEVNEFKRRLEEISSTD